MCATEPGFRLGPIGKHIEASGRPQCRIGAGRRVQGSVTNSQLSSHETNRTSTKFMTAHLRLPQSYASSGLKGSLK